jgi:hypothetical protein
MVMDYKVAMGAASVPRAQFRSRLQLARKCAAAASLPPHLWESATQSIQRATLLHQCVHQPIDACKTVEEVKELVLELRARGFGAQRIQEAMERIKEMRGVTAQQAQEGAAVGAARQDDESPSS